MGFNLGTALGAASVVNPVAALGTALAGADLALKGFQTYQNYNADQRNYEYQKNLQNTIFEREDNSVQRRMADLEAAGMNPYLASGSGAGAGTPVNVNAPHIGNMGSALDELSAVLQVKNQQKQTELLDEQINKVKADTKSVDINNQIAGYELGDIQDTYYFNRGYLPSDFEWNGNKVNSLTDLYNGKSYNRSFYQMPLINSLNFQLQSNKNSADLLQKQNEYYTSDKIFEYAGQFLPFMNYFSGNRGRRY